MISQRRLHSTINSCSYNSVSGSQEMSQSRTDTQHMTKASIIDPVSARQTGEGSAKFSTKLKSKPDGKPEVPKEDFKASKDKEAVQHNGGKPARKDDQNGAADAKTKQISKDKYDILTTAADNSGDSVQFDTKCAEDMSSIEFTVDGVKAVVCYGNIVNSLTNAIVNAAMGSLVNAGGVAMAIADAAGSKMHKEYDDFVKKHGRLETDKDYLAENSMLSGNFGVQLEICLKAYLKGFLKFTLEKRNLCEVHVTSNDPNVNWTSIIFLLELMQSPLNQLMSSALRSFEK
ncbi:hypothetical protein CHS0354_021641 [Potamilus streckersoni]|uniref:Macro domain-containing protein n=1 Tax=Potamilus streckersoni TaxID=2493646 RepID=A0AAE0SP11_9BIVA|nr:hypothetical protein CHS0354_021641 [Potamilus streckersoni]